MIDLDLFEEILSKESTSGTERALAEWIELHFPDKALKTGAKHPQCCRYEVGDGTLNLLFSWGRPKVVLCTHMDTVPPYIPPVFARIEAGALLPDGKRADKDDVIVRGRGSCDAKGQIISMWTACTEMSRDMDGFGLLLLSGEETGSKGAIAYDRDCPGADYIIVGEPTDNKMVEASKGTKAFDIRIHGRPCHSGYPELGKSAVDIFLNLMSQINSAELPDDPVLGSTTWNVGRLVSDNPQNVLSPLLTCWIYFRTTFASDNKVMSLMSSLDSDEVEIKALGGDTPMHYKVFDGYNPVTVAFGSDAPRLSKFPDRSLCGPGSIFVAHTDREYVLVSELEAAVSQYKDMIMQALTADSRKI